jgi:hypothetical protein
MSYIIECSESLLGLELLNLFCEALAVIFESSPI